MRKAINSNTASTDNQVSERSVRIQTSGLVLIIIIFAAGFFLLANISPRLTVTLSIERPQPYLKPEIKIIYVGYDKVSSGTALGTIRDAPVLSVIQGTQGTLTLTVTISYLGEQISAATFSYLSEGTYQIRATYLSRSESTGTPYVVDFSLLENDLVLNQLSINIFPV